MFNRALTTLLILLLPALAFAAKTNFVDGNKATGTRGTVVTSTFLNAVNNHRHDGANVDGSGILDYYQDIGTANAVVITPSPAINPHVVGMPIYVKVAAANTGAATIKVGFLTAVPLRRMDGGALKGGELSAGVMAIVSWDGTGYRLLNLVGTSSDTVAGNRVIRGYVWSDGTTTYGTGGNFTVTRDSAGTYTITYTPDLNGSGQPAVAFTPLGGIVVPVITGLSNTMTTVKFYNLSGALQDTGFTFIAVGGGK